MVNRSINAKRQFNARISAFAVLLCEYFFKNFPMYRTSQIATRQVFQKASFASLRHGVFNRYGKRRVFATNSTEVQRFSFNFFVSSPNNAVTYISFIAILANCFAFFSRFGVASLAETVFNGLLSVYFAALLVTGFAISSPQNFNFVSTTDTNTVCDTLFGFKSRFFKTSGTPSFILSRRVFSATWAKTFGFARFIKIFTSVFIVFFLCVCFHFDSS